ncbi:hypothetical protein TNCV_1692331 [Trichonephila clavipes]|nr:hypothetical protein TNCV_1692331 [Trichonephila clavipes]
MGGTLNSRRAASSLVRLVAGDERWETPDPPPGCSPSKLGWNRAKSYCHLLWCLRLPPTTGVHLAPCHDEFRRPRSDYIRQVALATKTLANLTPSFIPTGRHLSSDDAKPCLEILQSCRENPNYKGIPGIFYVPHNRATWELLIFNIMKTHRLGLGSNPQM